MFSRLLGLTPAEVVDREPRRADKFKNLVTPCLTGVASFGRDTRPQSESYEAEENNLKDGLVFLVKRSIQENVALKGSVGQVYF